VISTLFRIWIHPQADVISSAVFIGSAAERQKSGEIKASRTEKAVVLGGSKEIVGSLPEFANKMVLSRSGSHARLHSRSRSENAKKVSLDDRFLRYKNILLQSE